jgi:CheY-like chemotaxis protein
LLDPFSQADASTTRRFGGTGLGLAICRQLVELMGGALGYESQVGQGSTFWFDVSLPEAATPEAEAGPSPRPGLNGADPLLTPARPAGRVLLVDDSEVNQVVAKAMLEQLGCKVDVLSNGSDAVLAAGTCHYDAILMDCLMPEMDGYEATARIRRSEGSARHTTIVAVTASALNGDREKCLAAGMDDYISKPLSPNILATVLGRWIA